MRNSKQFEEDLHISKFDELESEFQEAKKFFENFKGKMSIEYISENFPGFCFNNELLYLKFPTYKIRILNNKLKYEEIENMLKPEQNFVIYEETNVITIPDFRPVEATAIHCLYTELSQNTLLAEKITDTLQKQGIYSERCVASALYSLPIKVDDDNNFEIVKH